MGIVYRARQISLNREVAVKLMRDSALARAEEVRRFHVEAAAAARLKHPNIVAVHEVGEEEEQHYFAMDLIEGANLAERARDAPFPARDAAALVAKIADAVQYAHGQGVLHRDLKPSNVLIDFNGQPFVTDFGLARPLDADSSLTITGQVLGTPGYMPPEQALGRGTVGPAADIYSLGALLYQLLTGRAPFVGGTTAETLRHVAEQEPVSPQLLNPGVPRDLASVCLKCLAKRPSERYVSAAQLAEDLHRFLRGEPTAARPTGATERLWRWCQRKPALAMAMASVLLIGAAGLCGILWQWRQATAAREDAVSKLWDSYLAQAHARRLSGVMGRRTESLATLAAAARIKPSPELRDEAIAALALRDLKEEQWIPYTSAMPYSDWASDPSLKHIAVRDHPKEAIRLKRLRDGQETELSFKRRNGRELRFSPDGRWLAAHYYSGELVLWDWQAQLPKLLTNVGRVSETFPLDFSHDNRILAVGLRTPQLRLFEVETGAELPALVFTNQSDAMRVFRWHPSRPRIAVGVGRFVQLWDYTSRKLVRTEEFPREVFTLTWHPDGRRLAVACWREPNVFIWDAQSSSKRVLPGVSTLIAHLAFHPQGDLLSCRGRDGATRLWDIVTERPVLQTESGLSMDFSSDGNRLAYDRETEGVGVWEVIPSKVYRTFRLFTMRPDPVESIDFSPDGRLIVWSGRDGLAWLDQMTGQVRGHTADLTYCVRFPPDARSLFTAGVDGLQRWTAEWNPNPPDGEPRVKPVTTILPKQLNSDQVPRWLAFSATGEKMALASRASVSLRTNGEPAGIFISNAAAVVSVAISADGKWLACGTEGQGCVIHFADSGAMAQRLDTPSPGLAFDPKGRWLVTGTVKEYCLWTVGDWRCVKRWPRKAALNRSGVSAFTKDGALLAIAHTPHLVQLVHPVSGEVLATLTPPNPLLVRDLVFSPDGAQLAIASDNGVAQLWDLRALRRELHPLGLEWAVR